MGSGEGQLLPGDEGHGLYMGWEEAGIQLQGRDRVAWTEGTGYQLEVVSGISYKVHPCGFMGE